MNRHEEITFKHEQISALLLERGAPALHLRQTRNIAWFTGGANASIPADSETGAYSILITPDARTVLTSNIEAPRLIAEEKFEEYGFAVHPSPWYTGAPAIVDGALTDDGEIGALIAGMRVVLTDAEKVRLRALGLEAGSAIEQAARSVQPGDSEWLIAARLDAACRARGGQAIVNLIATDERISQFRHPYITDKRVENLAMLVVCMRRGGLIVSASRFVHFGPVPAALREKLAKVAAIDAVAMTATQPGRTLGEVFADIQAAYAAQGEADQWQNHHQGGLGGYAAREKIATPGDATVIQSHQVFAWNPSIVGCKSEDTMVLHEAMFEIVTQTGNWPTVEIDINGLKVKRPDILEG